MLAYEHFSQSVTAIYAGAVAMNVWRVRPAKKAELELGRWEVGKMTRSAFPMSRSRTKAYRLGTAWSWRVIKFEAEGYKYRLLVAYRTDKEQFMATLAVEAVGDMKIVASLEYHHPTHGGWHIHYAMEPMDNVPSGVRKGPWVKRLVCAGHSQFGLGSSSAAAQAMTIVADVFGLKKDSDQELML